MIYCEVTQRNFRGPTALLSGLPPPPPPAPPGVIPRPPPAALKFPPLITAPADKLVLCSINRSFSLR